VGKENKEMHRIEYDIKTIGELHLVGHYRCSAPNCTYNYRPRKRISKSRVETRQLDRCCVVCVIIRSLQLALGDVFAGVKRKYWQ